MNITLATVMERTREIGIRRAMGAKRRHIIFQFLTETLLLAWFGGGLGIALGILAPHLVQRFAGMRTVVTVWSLLLASAPPWAFCSGFTPPTAPPTWTPSKPSATSDPPRLDRRGTSYPGLYPLPGHV